MVKFIIYHPFFFFVTVKPQTVNILTKEKYVSSEKRYEVECRTSGSRPEAVITWWKGSRPVKKLAKNVSNFLAVLIRILRRKNFCFLDINLLSSIDIPFSMLI